MQAHFAQPLMRSNAGTPLGTPGRGQQCGAPFSTVACAGQPSVWECILCHPSCNFINAWLRLCLMHVYQLRTVTLFSTCVTAHAQHKCIRAQHMLMFFCESSVTAAAFQSDRRKVCPPAVSSPNYCVTAQDKLKCTARAHAVHILRSKSYIKAHQCM